MSPIDLAHAFKAHLRFSQSKILETATPYDIFMSAAYLVRDRLVHRWIETQSRYFREDAKKVYYLSMEYLMGRLLTNNLINLGIYNQVKAVLTEMGLSLEDILEQEADAGLGNGGLGRLAACFMDSLATLSIPAYGYGIRYRFGIFEQVIRNGYQVEKPEVWLKSGNPWEIVRPEKVVKVDFYGRSEHFTDDRGRARVRWVGTKRVVGVPYDTPLAGFGTDTVNTLRLWHARASEEFDLEVFNAGDYLRAVDEKNESEAISKVLYPNDNTHSGKELRLKQQYFFVRCSLVDIIRRHLSKYESIENLGEKAAIQLNDTHPAIAVAELMRILVDKYRLEWEKAWDITHRTIAYTNHTVLQEALEKWPVELFKKLLPRHLEIIFEINRRFLQEVEVRWPGDLSRLSRMSLIEEGHGKRVRMAHLAIVGSHSINGVAALHTEILKDHVFRDFHEMTPEKFNNKTNGVTPRRWLLQCNPQLAAAITRRIGNSWITKLDDLEKLASLADDRDFRAEVRKIKRNNKDALATLLHDRYHVEVNPESLFDMQIKRMHEYKRQLLSVLHIISLYVRARKDPASLKVPRTLFLAGKAAPGYHMAKLTIKLIHNVSGIIAADPAAKGLQLVFIPNYRVTLAERMIPACELSEQISTSGMEASGTGNMKLSLNGALTIGTLDGANIEIRERVGAENFFLFGMTAQDIERTRRGGYNARAIYESNPLLKETIDLVSSGHFSPGDRDLFKPIVDSLLAHDSYRLLGDFASYIDCQAQVERAYLDQKRWNQSSILNIAKMGYFSSDRTIREYSADIWKAEPVQVKAPLHTEI